MTRRRRRAGPSQRRRPRSGDELRDGFLFEFTRRQRGAEERGGTGRPRRPARMCGEPGRGRRDSVSFGVHQAGGCRRPSAQPWRREQGTSVRGCLCNQWIENVAVALSGVCVKLLRTTDHSSEEVCCCNKLRLFSSSFSSVYMLLSIRINIIDIYSCSDVFYAKLGSTRITVLDTVFYDGYNHSYNQLLCLIRRVIDGHWTGLPTNIWDFQNRERMNTPNIPLLKFSFFFGLWRTE